MRPPEAWLPESTARRRDIAKRYVTPNTKCICGEGLWCGPAEIHLCSARALVGRRPTEQRAQALTRAEFEHPAFALRPHVEAAEALERHAFAGLEALVEGFDKPVDPGRRGGLVGLHTRSEATRQLVFLNALDHVIALLACSTVSRSRAACDPRGIAQARADACYNRRPMIWA